jgi:hypothetical protein
VDQHNDEAGSRYAQLEERIEVVLALLDEMTKEVQEIRQQQSDLIDLVKVTYNKKIGK